MYSEEESEAFDGLPSVEKTAKYLLQELLSVKRSGPGSSSTQASNNNVSGAHVTEKRW